MNWTGLTRDRVEWAVTGTDAVPGTDVAPSTDIAPSTDVVPGTDEVTGTDVSWHRNHQWPGHSTSGSTARGVGPIGQLI